ncbi:MAG: homoserine kinase [Desulfobacterales bacterium]|nr:homoserine kinase [Desulfobacterales bacterium]
MKKAIKTENKQRSDMTSPNFSKSDLLSETEELSKSYEFNKVYSLVELSQGFANKNYKLTTDSGIFLFRICMQQSEADMHYEIQLLTELKKYNFPAAYPVKRNDGNFISNTSSGKVILYEFVNGQNPGQNSNTVREIAEAVSLLNSIPNWHEFPKKNAVHIDECVKLITEFPKAANQFPDFFEYFTEQTDFLLNPLKEQFPKGIVHGDAFPDNTLFDGDRLIAVIDFEEACIDSLLFDIGITINGFCFENRQLNFELARVFLETYHRKRPITEKEFEYLPFFIQWGAHGMIYWHLRNNLLFIYNEDQVKRINELTERVKQLRNSEKEIMKELYHIGKLLSI